MKVLLSSSKKQLTVFLAFLLVALVRGHSDKYNFQGTYSYQAGDKKTKYFNPEIQKKSHYFRSLYYAPTTIVVRPRNEVHIDVGCFYDDKNNRRLYPYVNTGGAPFTPGNAYSDFTKSSKIKCSFVTSFPASGAGLYSCKNTSYDNSKKVRLDKFECKTSWQKK